MPILDDYADARTGDKGDTLIVGVLARSRADYERLTSELQSTTIAHHFQCSQDDVTVRPVPNIGAFVVKLRGLLGGGVTGSPVLDGHGKTLSNHMLTLPISGDNEMNGENQ